ncbi:MAG: fibronectin type III domain-containing protein [Gammaproteobacteria bacterium]|nr:fibronectin type III domain-containing protein [Gammaproteobacteria bacterium]
MNKIISILFYLFTFIALSACGGSGGGGTGAGAGSGTVPDAPSGLVATGISENTISLVWQDNSDNETGFIVQRSQTAGVNFEVVVSLNKDITSYTDASGLLAETTYYYRVLATNAVGNSEASNEDDAATLVASTAAPIAPAKFTANAESSSSISMSWIDMSDNENNFIIERSTSKDTGYEIIATLGPNTTEYIDTDGLAPETTYYYRIFARNNSGDSSSPDIMKATTLAESVDIPVKPTGLGASAISANRIDLTWVDKSDNETGFDIQRSTSSDSGFTTIGSVAANVESYSDTDGLSAETTYYYRVSAKKDALNSPFSDVASATTLAAAVPPPSEPTSLIAVYAYINSVTLSWSDNSDNETGFKVQRSTTSESGPFTTISTQAADSEGYTDTTVSAGTTYYYRIAAYNDGGNSYTNVKTLTTGDSAPSLSGPASANTASDFTLSWSYGWSSGGGLVSSGDGFQLQRSSTSSSSGFSNIYTSVGYGDRSANSEDIDNRASAGTYYYRVRAVYASSIVSAWSDVVAVTVASSQVTNTYIITNDNLVMKSSTNSSIENTAYASAENAVGCNWIYSLFTGIQDFVCAISLLYFNVDADISGKTIISATLKIKPEILPASFTQYNVWAVFENWTAGVTWNSIPQVYNGSRVLFNQPVTGVLYQAIDVTNIVQNWANGNYNNYGFLLEDNNVLFPNDTQLRATTYCSKEGVPGCVSPPQLTITYQ